MRMLLFIPVLCIIGACHNSSIDGKTHQLKEKRSGSVLLNKQLGNDPAQTPYTNRNKLIGAWAFKKGENAIFEISKNSFYYPEHEASYRYTVIGDSVKIKYDDFNGSFAFTFPSDDVLTLTGDDGENIYYRIK